MIDIEKLMKRCQIGTYSIDMANDLLADCYGTLGKQQARIAELEAEVERLRERPEYHFDMDRISDILDGREDGPLLFGEAAK